MNNDKSFKSSTAVFLISVYNGEKYLRETLESCVNQTLLPDRIIVINNGSSDGTEDILRDFELKNPNLFTLYHIENNIGKAGALKIGFDEITEDYILCIDADDVAYPNRLERQVEFMDQNPDVAISCSNIDYINSKSHVFANKAIYLNTREEFRQRMDDNEIIGLFYPATIIRTKVIKDLNIWFRQAYWPADDIDFWNRVSERGNLILVQDEILTKYRVHIGSITTSNFANTQFISQFALFNMKRRRIGHSEATIEEYIKYLRERSLKEKISFYFRQKGEYYYRASGFNYAERRMFKSSFYLLLSFICRPNYCYSRVKKEIANR